MNLRSYAALLFAALTPWLPAPTAVASPICCVNCSGPEVRVALPRTSLQVERWLARQPAPRSPEQATAGAGTFYGEIAGAWDDVDGYFTVPYEVEGLGTLEILLRGFATTPLGGSHYAVSGWDRSVYWLDVGDGMPRLLQALELANDYVPEPDDYFFDSQDVVDTCTPGAGCTLNLVPYLRYREFGADYSNRGYRENGEAFDEVQMAFVTDGVGDAIDAAVLFEEGIGTDPIQPFFEGDEIFMSIIAYKMDEPEFVYALGYMKAFASLQGSASISRANLIPGVDYMDPELPPDLDAGERPVRLVLDASAGGGEGYGTGGPREAGTFAYGGPFDLGFTWSAAQEFLYRNGYEALHLNRAPGRKLVRAPR